MKNWKASCVATLCCAIILHLSPCAASAASSAPTVSLTTPSGPIVGVLSGGIEAYKGIPYAEPPLGERRFAPTEAVRPWTEPLDCTDYGPMAMQESAKYGLSMSEDCLSLNVWTPARGGRGEKLPVYVFIHGGAYAQGSGAYPLYDGTNFAKQGIVAVTVNYRLNALGFFASDETFSRYGTTGNWGHLDQIKALEWIRDNVAAFGGDPDRVTIGGESAGSYSVSALLLSPLAEGLFHGAIMESGSILSVAASSYYAKGDRRRAVEVCGMMSWLFGAADDAEGLRIMREADAGTLAQLSPLDADYTKAPAFYFFPVYDGSVLPADPLAALAEGRLNGVRLLYGYNGDEGSIFVPDGTTEPQYKAMVTRMFGEAKARSILARFPVDGQNDSTQRARQVLSYGMFAPGMKAIADAFADRGLDVYGYYFDYESRGAGESGLGASHAAELPYVFHNLSEGATAEERKLADEMHLRWVNFIKNGDPNVGEAPPGDAAWPRYTTRDTSLIRFDREVVSVTMPDREDMLFMQDLMYPERPQTEAGGCSAGARAFAATLALAGSAALFLRFR